MTSDKKKFLRTVEAAAEEHFEPIGLDYSWVTRSGDLVWMVSLDEDPDRPLFDFKPVRYAHRDWVTPDMRNMHCGAVMPRNDVLPAFDESYIIDYIAIPGPTLNVFFHSGLPDRFRRKAPTDDARYFDLNVRKQDYEVFFRRLKENLSRFRSLEDITNHMLRNHPTVAPEAIEEIWQQRRETMSKCDGTDTDRW